MLAALLIVGLAMGGLVEAGFAIDRLQRSTKRSIDAFESARTVQDRFQTLLFARGPFFSDSALLEGDDRHFQFACGVAVCGAMLRQDAGGTYLRLLEPKLTDLPLDPLALPRFRYLYEAGQSALWPLKTSTSKRLLAVMLQVQKGPDPTALATARIWRQEAPDCQFDGVIKDCRKVGP